MPFAILLGLCAAAGGTLLTYLYDEDAPPLVRLCEGAATGLAALALVGFLAASLVGMTPGALAFAGLALAGPLLLLRRAGLRARLLADARAVTLRGGGKTLAAYAAVALVCWLVFAQAMYTAGGGVWTGLDNNIGDLPFHVAIVNGFVHGDNFPPEHPEFAGTRLTYPFLADFLTAMFVRAGASLEGAMFWQGFVLALACVVLLHRWARLLTGDRLAAALTPALVLLNGGLGFWHFLKTAAAGQGFFDALGRIDRYYTMAGDAYKWGNFVAIVLVPQRGLLLGLPLALVVWTLWWKATVKSDGGTGGREGGGAGRGVDGETRKSRKKKGGRRADETASIAPPAPLPPRLRVTPSSIMLAAGVLAGLLPLVHAHTFVVMLGMGAGVAVLTTLWGAPEGEGAGAWRARAVRAWAFFFGAALLLAVPQMLWATRGSGMQAASFFGWQFGWDRGEQSFVTFWLKNTGLFIPLLVAALAWRGREPVVPRRLLLFYAPFVACFVGPNLFRLSPWVWDNIKILFYWWVASAPLVALLLASLWRRGEWVWRAWVCAAVCVLTLAGALDVWRVVSGNMRQQTFSEGDEAFAALVRRETPPRSLILIAPTYNHPVYLTGRRALMGYAGHLYSHGLSYQGRERDLASIYRGGPEAEALIRRYGVGYVVVGPHERQGAELARLRVVPNEAFFQQHYTKVGQAGGYSLYKTAP